MSQSKKNSIIESLVNTFIGMLITFILSPIIYWMANVEISLPKMGICTVLFTIISVLRNYGIRRYFEWREKSKKETPSNSQSQSPGEANLCCPSCGHSKWYSGPGGGSYGNIECGSCGKRYNNLGPFGLQPIN